MLLREDNHMAEKLGRPVKVLHVVTRMNTGGVAVLLDDLMSSFDPRLVEATLLTGSCDETEEDYLSVRKQSYRLIRVACLQKKFNPQKDIQAFLEIRRLIKSLYIDVVHTHTSKAGFLGRLAASTVKPRSVRVHTFHGHLLTGYFSSWKTRLVYSIEKFLELFTDSFVAMGSQVRKDLESIGLGKRAKFKVFFPGLPSRVFEPKLIARKELGFAENGTYVLFVGRMTAIKRPDRLLDSIKELVERKVDIQVLAAGDGELLASLRDRAVQEDLPIVFLGWRSDISKLISASDIAILTSDNEAVPLTLIEASMAGLPLVSTNVGSVSDVLVNDLNGYLVDSEPAALADALQKLAIDPVLREIMGKAGRERTSRYFSLEKMCADHTELYQLLHR
jgi:glycosyltransferase involved in cell wall biosynthesis